MLAGFALRLPALFGNTFSADEALFATWARLIAIGRDPLLRGVSVDKPPLLFYTQSVFYPLFGPVEWAARWPSLIASLALIVLVAVLARQWTGSRVAAVAAAALLSLSPLAVRMAATGYIDPLLTTLLVAALLLHAAPTGAASRPGWAGVLFGLAILTKYQAWLFWPLLVGMGGVRGWRAPQWRRWLVAWLPFVLLLLLWGGVALQWQGYGGIRPIRSWELWPRALAWWAVLRTALPWPVWLTLPLLLLGKPADRLLGAFIISFLALHWLLAIPVWERYMLPLLPLACVGFGRIAAAAYAALHTHSPNVAKPALIASAVLLLAVAAPDAARASRGMPTADSGAAAVAQQLADAPYGTVLYDHWYSWQWRYHFLDKGVYVSWFAHPAALVENLDAFYDDARYIALPTDDRAVPIVRALADGGYALAPVASAQGIALYHIER